MPRSLLEKLEPSGAASDMPGMFKATISNLRQVLASLDPIPALFCTVSQLANGFSAKDTYVCARVDRAHIMDWWFRADYT